MKRYIRPNILNLEPYSTARDDFKGQGITTWLDANESPYNNGANRYPDPHQSRLKECISQLFDISPRSIFVGGAGSDEAIDIAFRIFCEPGRDNVIAISPSYGVYKVAAAINNIQLREVLLNSDFSLPVDALLNAGDSHSKIIWICSPNNPTGNAFPVEDIIAVADRFDGIVVVDEAYADFSDKGSVLPFLSSRRNIIVLRTFSKARGMAGLRAGMAFASEEIIEFFDRVKYPYNMSSLVQEELLRRIKSDPIPAYIAETKAERELMVRGLTKSPCVEQVFPSDANFVLVKVGDAAALYDYLVAEGVLVRNRSSMPLCDQSLRITIGTPEENSRVISLINNFKSL